MIAANTIEQADVASIFFSVTPDIDACFPAKAARFMGWKDVALLCLTEIAVPDGLPMVIRILMHWNTEIEQHKIQHQFLRGAEVLRPDLVTQDD